MNQYEIKNIHRDILATYDDIPYHFGHNSLEALSRLTAIPVSEIAGENRVRSELYLGRIFEKFLNRDYAPRPSKIEYEDYNFIRKFQTIRSNWSFEDLKKFNGEMGEEKATDIALIEKANDLKILDDKGCINKTAIKSLGYVDIKSAGSGAVRMNLIADDSNCVGRALMIWSGRIQPHHYHLGFAFCHKDELNSVHDADWIQVMLGYFDFSFYLNEPLLIFPENNSRNVAHCIELENCSRLAELVVFREMWRSLKDLN